MTEHQKNNFNSAIFLDRDGTINEEVGYAHRIDQWAWIPGSIEAIKKINRSGFKAIVVSNQSGIARGLYDASTVERLHSLVQAELHDAGAWLDDFFICPHHPEFGQKKKCYCRKPNPGMIFEAQRKYFLNLKRSWIIGDKISDVIAGKNAGLTPILVKTGHDVQQAVSDKNINIKENLLDAVNYIISNVSS